MSSMHAPEALSPTRALWILILILACAPLAAEEALDLFRFSAGFDLAAVQTQDAKASIAGSGGESRLRVETGVESPWPGITLKAPEGSWDLSRRAFLSLEVANRGEASATIYCRVDNPGADGRKNCVTGSAALDAGRSGSILIQIQPRIPGAEKLQFIGMRGNPPVTSALDPASVTQLVIFAGPARAAHVFEISSIRAGGERGPAPESVSAETFFPMIDELGQYIHKEWPGKNRSVEDLKAAREAEEKELAARPGPPDRSRYGGWAKGPQLEATGFFRAEKLGGKWWLVDPDGRLFWSHGIDCVRSSNATPITDRE
ncbi:MAG: hypothetical protein JXA90_12895, partial [Planctomycetes bacterium]|nr:hypothetical protein [Planctomycetota bacterium]